MFEQNVVIARLSRRLPQMRSVLADPDRPLRELGLDSIDLVELLCAIESEFAVRLSDDDVAGDATVGKLVDLIELRGRGRLGQERREQETARTSS